MEFTITSGLYGLKKEKVFPFGNIETVIHRNSHLYAGRGFACTGSIDSAEPVDFERRFLEPVNFW